MNRIYLAIARWSARKAGIQPHGHECAHCQQPRGKRDRYRILAWEHLDCGQPAAPPLPEPLYSQLERERI